MALHWKIDWTSAMRDIRKDRRPANPSLLAARSLEIARLDRLAKEAGGRPFFAAGSFDRSAIMTAAIAKARLERAKGRAQPKSAARTDRIFGVRQS
jgi:hypothetical protein